MDKIIVKGLKMYAYHGVNQEEQINGQYFVMDIECCLNLGKVCVSDNIDDTLNYSKLVKLVRKVFTANKYETIERAAEVTSDNIFKSFSNVKKVNITLKKPDAPVDGDFEYVAVEISRDH